MLLGARQFFERRGAPTPPLPYDAEVEYLESTGAQYIYLPITAGQCYGFDLSMIDVATTAYNVYVGNGTSNDFCVGVDNGNINSSYVRIRTALTWANKTGATKLISANNGIITANGANVGTYDASLPLGNNNNAMGMFAYSGGVLKSICRIMSYKLYGAVRELLLDVIPVRFTNELGNSEGAMYDRVSGQLFRNAGTGAFSYGADVYRIPSTVGQYVQNGIVQQWDGIENAGIGLRYVAATKWNDIITGKYFGISAAYEDGVSFTGSNNALANSSTAASYTADHDLTLHTVVTAPNVITYEVQAMIALGKDSFNKNGFVLGGIAGYSNLMAYWSSAYSGGTRYLVDTGKGTNAQFSLDFVFDYANLQFKVYVDGAQVGTTQTIDSSVWNLDGVTTLRLGMGANSGKLNDATGFRQHGIILYNRKLTAAEIAANYAIDKARFNLP